MEWTTLLKQVIYETAEIFYKLHMNHKNSYSNQVSKL